MHLPDDNASVPIGFFNQIGMAFKEGTHARKPQVKTNILLVTRNLFFVNVAKGVLRGLQDPHAHVQNRAEGIVRALI